MATEQPPSVRQEILISWFCRTAIFLLYNYLFFYFRGHVEDVYDLAWSPDSNQLITGSVDNSAIIWDANKGE